MRLRSLLVTASALCTVPLAAAAAGAEPGLPPYCSVVCQRDVAFEEFKSAPGERYRAAQSTIVTAVGQPAFEEKLNAAVGKFKTEEDRLTAEIASWKKVKRTTEMAFAMKDDLIILDGLPTSTASAHLGQAWDDEITKLETQKQALAGKVLGPALEEIRAENAQALLNLEGKSPQEVHLALFGPDGRGGLVGGTDLFAKLDAEGKADLANLKIDIVHSQLAQVSAGLAHTQDQVNALIDDYTKFKAAVAQHVDTTRKQIAAIVKSQQALTRAYETLAGEVQDNTFRLDALEGVMWSKLTAQERVAALKSGAFSSVVKGMPEDKRKAFEEDLEEAAKLEKIYNTAGAAAQVANDFAAIGAVFNIDLAEPARRVNEAATVVQSAIQIASGNPLAVISGLGGLARVFGGGGGDGTSAALAALRRDIMQMRREMYEYHVREMKALEALSEQIDERFTQLASLQAGTLDQLGFNTLQLDELLKDNLNACVTLSRRWSLEPYETLDDRAGRINLNDRYLIIRCRDGIEDRFYRYAPGGQMAISTIFSLQALTEADRADPARANQILAVQRFRDETLLPTVSYVLREHPFRSGIGNCRPEQVAFAGLLGAPKRDGDLRAEAEAARRRCAAGATVAFRAQDGSAFDLPGLLGTPLSIENIAGYGRVVHDVATVWEFVDSPGAADPRIMSLEQLYAVPPTGAARADTPARQLRKVLDLVNLSVAQVNLLGGDLVLEVIAEDIEKALGDPANRNLASIDKRHWSACTASGSASARYFNALCVLQRNEALRYNFVRHWTRTRLENAETTPFRRYAVGMSLAEPSVLTQAFRRPMPIVRCGQTWCLKLPGADIPDPVRSPKGASGAPDDHYDLKGDMLLALPAWSDVATDRQAVATPQIDLLLGLRRDIVGRVSELMASRKLTEEERRFVYATLVVAEAERDPRTEPGAAAAEGPPRPDEALRD